MSTSPKVVVFDLGKVLVDFDYGRAIRAIASRGTVPVTEVQRLLAQTPLLIDYETGRVTTEQFCRNACRLTGYSGTAEEFHQVFGDIFSPLEEMIQFQE